MVNVLPLIRTSMALSQRSRWPWLATRLAAKRPSPCFRSARDDPGLIELVELQTVHVHERAEHGLDDFGDLRLIGLGVLGRGRRLLCRSPLVAVVQLL